ncbi:MAG: sugar ABC transporter permease [Candidatus Limiplasma sp.]|nr:sugar ABC transporter permease [Candidatus Limiplasma sp.]
MQARSLSQASYGRSRRITYACFVFPAFALYLVTVILPFFQGIPYSMTNWNLVSSESEFVGFKNYINLLNSSVFWTSIGNTFQYAFSYIVFSNLLGLGIAMMIHKPSRINNASRALIFMPYVISMLTAAFAWKYIFNTVYSPLFQLPSPLGVKSQAMFGIVVISVWRTSGYCMLIYIAALQGVPQEYYEAASVEGANGWQRFVSITVPMILPAFSVNVSLLLAWGLKVFDTVMATTNGGPGRNTTLTMAMFIYNNVFGNSKAGYGQAAAVLMTIILLTLSFLVSKFFRSKGVDA